MLVVFAKAQTFSATLQPDVSGMDAAVYSASATTNYSTSTTLSSFRDASNNRTRGLLMFDLSVVPTSAIITSAKIILKGLSHSGTNPSYLRPNTSAWAESTLNWNVAPVAGNPLVTLPQSTLATQDYTVDVKNSIQKMINVPASNFGWTLIKQIEVYTGGLVFASSDYSVAASRPQLQLTWCLPMDVKANMTAATSSVTANGALTLNVTNGVPPYAYVWSDASTNKDILNKLPAVYSVTVTDNAGNQVKKQLIIGAENTSMTFTLTPDALAGKDALINANDNGTLVNDNDNVNTLFQAKRASSSGWFKTRGFIEFDLYGLPSNATVSSATLNLYGSGHNYTRPNNSFLYINTSPWTEPSLTWNTQPSHTTANSLALATSTAVNQNYTLNVTSQVQNWVQNPSDNFGWKLMLNDEATSNYATMSFGSSDHGTAGLRPNLIITVNIPASTESSRNWKLEETYDQNGQVIASSKVYVDDFGRTTQSLSKDANGDVFASQTVYDAYGRASIQSLPAYAGNTLTYKTNFMLNTSGTEYNYNNFDVTGKISTPDGIQTTTVNTLGYYYSDNNAMDTWQATATNPYSRTHYMADPYNSVKTSNGVDNSFKAGTGREARNYSMVCGDELKFIFGSGNSYKVKVGTSNPMTSTAATITTANYIKASKSITTSPDNKEVISYTIGDKVIATCMSGLLSPDNCSMTTIKNYMNWYGTQSIDIHVPDANKGSVSVPLPTYVYLSTTYTVANADISYVITDMNTENQLVSTTDYSINASTRTVTFLGSYATANAGKPLFLRIRVAYTPGFVSSTVFLTTAVPSGIVQYNLDYGRWSINYYDFAGNLRKMVSAKGINCSSPGTITMAAIYDYSHLGQLVAKQTPDEGLTEVAYNKDGQARFTQNPEQKLNNRFSYVNYDLHGRAVENGEFSNTSLAGFDGYFFQNYYGNYTAPYSHNPPTSGIIDNADGLNDTYCNDATFISYEELSGANDIPAAYTYSASYIGKYKNGAISKTWNANTTTWYKYDVAGRLFATIKKVNDAEYSTYAGSTANAQIKTYENLYDSYFGNVTNSYFQKNVATEYAEHQLIFDANKRLSITNLVTGAGNAPSTLNKLSYDKLGRLKRQVIGPDLQGIDYVYTINGALKAINHSSLDYTKDRGQDLRTYNDANAGVKQDLFGEILEYYPSDYVRTGTSIETNTVGLYNGQIYGSRFKTRNDVNGTLTGANDINGVAVITTTNYGQQELANRYTYDNFGQLATSTFGTYTNTTNSFTPRTDYKEYGTSGSIAYDANGNITGLKRNAYNTVLLDDLTYTISSTGNRHTEVKDLASNSFPMTFNFKNQNTTPGTFAYNTNGQLTASPDESVTAVSYYPNGQVKQVNFANGNTTTHYYDDQGQKYKSKYVNAGSTKINWFLFGAIYEYVTAGTFNLKELSIGGVGRVGVYKQDVTGLFIASGHAEYALTDHLGNVRVTFKKGTGTNLDVLSKTDYYAFGGPLPGRIWQQSGGDYRYGYQGQEKSQDATNWDNFELRNFNHDLGRWSSPDPYGQFHSPYVAMANNPITHVDPDGGYIYGNGAQQAGARLAASPSLGWFCQVGPLGSQEASIEGCMFNNLAANGELGGFGGGGGGWDPPKMGIFGASIWDGGIGFDDLDKSDGTKDGIINGSETEAEYNESTYDYGQSLSQQMETKYDAFVNTLGKSGDYVYDKFSGTYGQWETKFYMEAINPDKPIYYNTSEGLEGGLSIVAESFFYRSFNSVEGNGGSLLSSASTFGANNSTEFNSSGKDGIYEDGSYMRGKKIEYKMLTGVGPDVGFGNSLKSLWKLTKAGSSVIKTHKTWGSFYKSISDGLWWSTDKIGHGGSKYKVFKETSKGLEWYKDADEFGNFILDKYKGPTGTFLPWKQFK